MKYIIAILFFVSFFLKSCDKINKPYMVEDVIDVSCDTIQFDALESSYRKIVLEEFTGHTCVNCPDGHRRARLLIDKYADSIVAIAIHAGVFAIPEPPVFPNDYRTQAGTEMTAAFGVEGYPSGMINRKPFNSSLLLDRTAWNIAASNIDKSDVKVAIQMQSDYNFSTNRACIHIKTTFLQDISETLKLSVFLIEDSIISPQKNIFENIGDVPVIQNYVHKNMLRTAINTTWGETIASGNTLTQSYVYKGYGFSFGGKPFVVSRCRFVAIVYNADTYEILQANQVNVVTQ